MWKPSKQQFPAAEMERMMKTQEVILKAMAGKLKWWEAAEIMGVTDRTMRRWRERMKEHGYSGLWDYRKRQPEPEAGADGRSWSRCCSCTGSSISTSTCGTFTRSCERSTGSSSATRG